MNFDELHSDGCLKGLPLRAKLTATGEASPCLARPAWVLEFSWVAAERRVLLSSASLRRVRLGSIDCCVVLADAITTGEGTPRDEDYRAVAYLLSPAEKCVWEAVDSWVRLGSISTRESSRGGGAATVMPPDLEVLGLRDLEGEELDSDLLAGAIEKLLMAGLLEAELTRQLDIKVPLHCAVVETPMLLKSMQPIDPEVWQEHVEHYWNKGLNEGIWS